MVKQNECEKTIRALAAMKELGFKDLDVRAVIGELLQAYEGDWTHIEADHFDVLVQALLEYDPAKNENPGNKRMTLDKCLSSPPLRARNGEKSPESTTPSKAENLNKKLSPDKEKNLQVVVKQESPSSRDGGPSSSRKPGSSRRPEAESNGTRRHRELAPAQPDKKKFKMYDKHDENDLSKGQEKVAISLVRGISSRHVFPEDFNYISTSIVYDKAAVNISLNSIGDQMCCTRCFNNCLKKKVPCACSRDTDGEFAYDDEGCLRPKFLEQAVNETRGVGYRENCKGPCPMELLRDGGDGACRGHIVRKFVKECWSKCSCHKTRCGNRIVQQGVRYKLEVFWVNEAKGWGVRCKENLPQGAFICEYAGEILTNNELWERNNSRGEGDRHTYPMVLNADVCSERIFGDDILLCLDATNYGNVARFINHRCDDANLIDVPVQIESPHRHYYHVAFFTKRPVRAYEELTWDYQIDFEDTSHPIAAFRCRCGSSICREKKRQE